MSSKIKHFIPLFLIFFFATQVLAQSYSVSGFVSDSLTGEALIGANVFFKDAGFGASTNVKGFWVVPNLPSGKHSLVISYVGYSTQTLQIDISSKNQMLKIKLLPSSVETKEVIVSADSIPLAEKLYSKPVSKIELNAIQVNSIPKMVEADLLRALQTLPGIMALSDFSSALYVRGGTPDQNLYLVDGTDVYNPEHAFGIFSTFNTNAIKKVELSKGGFGAEYGGRLSSILDVTNLDGNRNNFEGIVNISLISASATLQTPLGQSGSLSGSLRRTYIDQTYAEFVEEIPDYYFYDGNLKAFFDLGNSDKLSFSFFRSQDNLDFKLDKDARDSFGFLYRWGNTTGSLNWTHIFGNNLFSNFIAAASYYKSAFDMPKIQNVSEFNDISDFSLKGSLEYYILNNLNLKFGLENKFIKSTYRQTWDDGLVDITETRNHFNSYLSAIWRPVHDLEFESGLRFDSFTGKKDFHNYSPRFSAKYRINSISSVKFATGIYYQYLNRIPRAFFNAIWTSADEYYDESRSIHYILGYQRELPWAVSLETDVYYKEYNNIHQFNQNFLADVTPTGHSSTGKPLFNSTRDLFSTGNGESYGVEFMLKKETGIIDGWIAYSFAKTKYSFPGINKDKKFVPRHDRSSVVNIVLNTNLTELFSSSYSFADKSQSSWLFGMNFIYTSGQPLTVPSSAYYTMAFPDWNGQTGSGKNTPSFRLDPSEINEVRLPPYIRLDLSITYQFMWGKSQWAPYLQIINAGNRKNIWFINYTDKMEGGVVYQEIEEVNMLPILPSLGVTIKF